MPQWQFYASLNVGPSSSHFMAIASVNRLWKNLGKSQRDTQNMLKL
jgi:hypothetical protein